MPAEGGLPDVTVRHARPEDLDALVALSRKTFTDKFGHLYRPEDLASFLATDHGPEVYKTALASSDVLLRVAETADGQLAAYLVCGSLTLPARVAAPGAVELKRLYVDTPLQGRGLGSQFIEESFDWAHRRRAPEIYLSVFSENFGAQRIYERYGFEKIGEFWFPVGAHRDLEFLMRRKIG